MSRRHSHGRPWAGRPYPACLRLTALEDRATPATLSSAEPSPTPAVNVDPTVLVEAQGGTAYVSIMDGSGVNFRLTPFPGFDGPIETAVGDVNGDGHKDVVVAAGKGGGPAVAAFDGTTGRQIGSFFAYDPSFRGGVDVDVGDIDGDGIAEVVTGVGPGGGPHVRAFRATTGAEVLSYFAYESSFRGGVDVACMDADGDGRAEIVTAPGAGGGPRVCVFDAQTRSEVASFYVYDPGLKGGVVLRSVGFQDGSVMLETTAEDPSGTIPANVPLRRMIDLSDIVPPDNGPELSVG